MASVATDQVWFNAGSTLGRYKNITTPSGAAELIDHIPAIVLPGGAVNILPHKQVNHRVMSPPGIQTGR